MKKFIILLLIFICIFIMTGCKTLSEGTVYSKTHIPEHRNMYFMPVHTGKMVRLIPRYSYHPNSWEVCVKNEKDRDCWNVSEEFYDSVEIGEYIYKKDF